MARPTNAALPSITSRMITRDSRRRFHHLESVNMLYMERIPRFADGWNGRGTSGMRAYEGETREMFCSNNSRREV
jgi:hypothetical protein